MAQNNKNMDNINYQHNNGFGVFILLFSYCGLGLFMIYKVIELILSHIN